MSWLVYSIVALCLWGVWGFFTKLATNYMDSETALVYQYAGSFLACLAGFVILRIRLEAHAKGISYALLAGLSGTIGFFFFMAAISKYKASVVVTLTALYPLVTVLLSVFILKESITLKKALGIVLALIAMVLFST